MDVCCICDLPKQQGQSFHRVFAEARKREDSLVSKDVFKTKLTFAALETREYLVCSDCLLERMRKDNASERKSAKCLIVGLALIGAALVYFPLANPQQGADVIVLGLALLAPLIIVLAIFLRKLPGVSELVPEDAKPKITYGLLSAAIRKQWPDQCMLSPWHASYVVML